METRRINKLTKNRIYAKIWEDQKAPKHWRYKMAVKVGKRALELGAAIEEKEASLDNMVLEYFLSAKAKNEATNKEKKLREKLLKTMKDRGIKSKRFEFKDEKTGKVLYNLSAVVAAPESEKADVAKLFKIVGPDLFLKVVSATKKAIVEFCGEAVFTQVKVPHTGDENVTVSVIK